MFIFGEAISIFARNTRGIGLVRSALVHQDDDERDDHHEPDPHGENHARLARELVGETAAPAARRARVRAAWRWGWLPRAVRFVPVC